MIANEFVPTPVSTFGYLRQAGLIGPHGLAAKQGLRHLLPRMQRVVGPVQEVTSADSRVRLDPAVTDSLGIPVARLSGRLHPNDFAVQQLLGERAADWLRASGATTAITYGSSPENVAPRVANTRPEPAGWEPTRRPRSPIRTAGSGAIRTCE